MNTDAKVKVAHCTLVSEAVPRKNSFVRIWLSHRTSDFQSQAGELAPPRCGNGEMGEMRKSKGECS